VNVLLGEMSIVGPRPHPVALNEAFAERISPLSRRHKVKPGITGCAQVHGYRGETDTIEKMRRRIECDLYYIDNWSFLLDIKNHCDDPVFATRLYECRLAQSAAATSDCYRVILAIESRFHDAHLSVHLDNLAALAELSERSRSHLGIDLTPGGRTQMVLCRRVVGRF
jgi:hypothetical protein